MSEAPAHKVRPYFWSVRREIWENPAIWIAPLAVMAVVLVAFLFGLSGLPKQLRIATDPVAAAASAARADAKVETHRRLVARAVSSAAGPPVGETSQSTMQRAMVAAAAKAKALTPAEKAARQQKMARSWINLPYSAAAGSMFITAFFVMIFYSLNALHGERRDRSILFWKSLPVSDTTTVLAKATLPLAVQPLLIIPIIFAGQLVMLALASATVSAAGLSPALMWPYLHLDLIWVMAPYGILVNVLWGVPLFGWLFVVSAWAKKNTFVWAVAPWFAAALFVMLVFHTGHVIELIQTRIFGGYELAYTVGGKGGEAISSWSQVDPGRFFSAPGLWGGLAVGAGFFALVVWLRRTRDPI